MPFEGIRAPQAQPQNSGGLDMILRLRQNRMAEEKAQADAEFARMKNMQESQKRALEIDALRRKREAEIGPLVDASNDPSLSNTDRQTAANQAVRGINQSIVERSPTGVIQPGVPETVGGNVGSAGVLQRREDIQEIDKIIRKAGAEARGDLQKGNVLISQSRTLRRQIAAGRSQGLDTSLQEEKLFFAEKLKQGLTKKGQITVTNPPSANLVRDVQVSFNASHQAEVRLRDLQQRWKNGEIDFGVGGSLRFGLEFTTDWLNDLASSAQIEGPGAERLAELANSVQNTSGGVNFESSNGEQLTLDLDSMALAWQYVKSWKNSARITLLEFETALKQLRLTGLNRTESQTLSALRKVSALTLRSKGQDRAFMNADFSAPLGPQLLGTEPTASELKFINGWNAKTRRRTPRPETPVDGGASFDTLPENPTPAQIREAMRNAAGGAPGAP